MPALAHGNKMKATRRGPWRRVQLERDSLNTQAQVPAHKEIPRTPTDSRYIYRDTLIGLQRAHTYIAMSFARNMSPTRELFLSVRLNLDIRDGDAIQVNKAALI